MLKSYGDGSVFGQPFGEGPPRVIWLPGWGHQSDDFVAVSQLVVAQGVSSVALDLPGFGASPAPSESGGARSYAQLLVNVVGTIASEPVVLVGHSFGGTVALVLAATHPELVRALVLTGAPLVRRSSGVRAPVSYQWTRQLHRWGVVSDDRLERARQRYGSPDYRAATGTMREVLVASVNESYEFELDQWRGPTTLLWGANDTEVPVATAERAKQLLAAASLRVVANIGHWVPTEAPRELAEATLEMVS